MPRITHGATLLSLPLYRIYNTIKQRLDNPRHDMFRHYGGRGIALCEEWQDDPLAFVTWALANGYRQGLSIDRIDVDGDYSPQNCRWADAKTQSRNRRYNRMITHNGETRCMADWGEITGIPPQNIAVRLDRCGWSVERALTEQPVPRHRSAKTANIHDHGDSILG